MDNEQLTMDNGQWIMDNDNCLYRCNALRGYKLHPILYSRKILRLNR